MAVTVDFGMVSGSLLEFASITCARCTDAPLSATPSCDATCEGCGVTVLTRVRTRAGRTSCMVIRVGSTNTNEGALCPFPKTSLPVAIWRNRGAIVLFSVVRTSRDLLHPIVVSEWETSEDLLNLESFN